MGSKNIFLGFMLIMLSIGSCTFEEKIRDGNTAFERKQYAKAIKLLEAEYKKTRLTSEKGDKAFKIGESYRLTYQPEKASEWYLKTLNSMTSVDAMKQYAFTLKQVEKYDAAIRAFKDLGQEIGDPFEYQREIIACRQAKAWNRIQKKADYQVELLSFNTRNADYYPVVYENDKIVITSDRASSTGEEVYNWTGNDFSDLFVVDVETGAIENFSEVLNSEYNEGTIAFNSDFSQAIFTRCGNDNKKEEVQYCKLFFSEKIGDSWSKPEELTFTEDKVNYGHPSFSADGNTLYFACDHPDGLGGFDIFTTKRTADGWSDPQNLGTAINTEGNEISPFLDVDTLYFASDKHVGMGGFDVFKTSLMNNTWGPLKNLKSPVNSGADDFGFSIDYRKEIQEKNVIHTGYFTSTRKGGKGGDDIYKFSKVIPEPDPEPIDTTADSTFVEKPKIDYKMILEGRIVEKVFNTPNDPNSGITGKTALAGATVQVLVGDSTFTLKPSEDGKFIIELNEQSNYNFFASKKEYLTNNASFSTRGIENDPANPIQRFSVEIILDKLYTNVETILPIFYDYDKWEIRPDARPILNRLATLLRQNPAIKIELASHTDCRGNDDYNGSLSQKRAQSAVDYLVARGIDIDRMVARGYGESRPAEDCACNRCNDDQHQKNRRTTFTILDE